MDIIDLLWALVGWFLIIPDMIMAARCTFKNSSKSNAFYLFLGLIFLLQLVVVVNSSESDPSSIPSTKTQIFVPAASSKTTVTLHRLKRNRLNSRSSSFTRRQYEAGEHEVPSGPNPISN